MRPSGCAREPRAHDPVLLLDDLGEWVLGDLRRAGRLVGLDIDIHEHRAAVRERERGHVAPDNLANVIEAELLAGWEVDV